MTTSSLKRPMPPLFPQSHELCGSPNNRTKTLYQGYSKGIRSAGKNYTTTYGQRSTPVSDEEKQYRTYWGQLAAAVAARLKDPVKQPQDQAAFKAQTEHSTLRKFVWAKVAEEMAN